MSVTVKLNGAYLDRLAHRVGIVKDRGEGQRFRWLTTRGYYVTADGRAGLTGISRADLVRDITAPEPTEEQVRDADSMFGCLKP